MRTMTKRPRSIDCDFKRTWEKSPMSIPSHRGFVLREKKENFRFRGLYAYCHTTHCSKIYNTFIHTCDPTYKIREREGSEGYPSFSARRLINKMASPGKGDGSSCWPISKARVTQGYQGCRC